MALLTGFRSAGSCSNCRAYGALWVTNHYGSLGATYRIGDDVGRDIPDTEIESGSYVVKAPRPGEPIRVLSTWSCETCRRETFAELVFFDGWLTDLVAVEPTVADLDRIHYIAEYNSSSLESIIGRSMWDEHGVWPGWLAALRESLARREAMAPEVLEEGDFPLGGALDGGRFRVVEHFLGGGADQLYFARSAEYPDARYLVSTTIDNGLDRTADVPQLLADTRGVFAPRFVGSFDPSSDGGVHDQERRSTIGYVEEVPPGWPLPLTRAQTAGHAYRLAAEVGERLLAAAAGGYLDVGLRPEYVWIALRLTTPVVTGIGGRNRDFFAAAGRRRDLRTAPLFTQRYVAPEVSRGEPYDERALVLTLAVMTAEWLIGRYPYEDGDGAWGYNRLCRGEHLELPGAPVELLAALRPAPADRPDLATFVRALTVRARS